MNLGRFHAAIYSIKEEIDKDNNFDLINQLQTKLQDSISQQTPESAKIFKDGYASLISTLEKAESNYTFPTRRKIYSEIGAKKYIGIGLLSRIEDVMSKNQITPANALVEIQTVASESKAFYDKLIILDQTFSELDVDYDELESGDFEVGFSFPHEIIGSDIESLEKEFHQLDFVLKTFQEISLGKVGVVKVKTISASEWQVFLESLPELAVCITIAIERIVALYKNNLEIKLLKKQLDEKNLPAEVTAPLQSHIETAVKAELRKVAEELVNDFYKVDDDGRKNELKNKASQALSYLADRMDHGATVEVHSSPPEEPVSKSSESNDSSSVDVKALEEYKRIKEISDKVNKSSISILELEKSTGPMLSINFEDESSDELK